MDVASYNSIDMHQRKFVVDALKSSRGANQFNAVLPWTDASIESWDGRRDTADSSVTGYWGWWTFTVPEDGLITFRRLMPDGNYVDHVFGPNSDTAGIGRTIFGWFHAVTVEGGGTWSFLGWKTDEELFIPGGVAGFLVVWFMNFGLALPTTDVIDVNSGGGTIAKSIQQINNGVIHITLFPNQTVWLGIGIVPALSDVGPYTAADDYDVVTVGSAIFTFGGAVTNGQFREFTYQLNDVQDATNSIEMQPKIQIAATQQVLAVITPVNLTPVTNVVDDSLDANKVRTLPGVPQGIVITCVLPKNAPSADFADDYDPQLINCTAIFSGVAAGANWNVSILNMEVLTAMQGTGFNFLRLF